VKYGRSEGYVDLHVIAYPCEGNEQGHGRRARQ
jgi:hypothetical protein